MDWMKRMRGNARSSELPDVNGHADSNPSERWDNLQKAVRTLRAIRQRYETGRNARPDARCYSVQMAVGFGDMAWIAAAIEALETSVTDVAQTATPTCG